MALPDELREECIGAFEIFTNGSSDGKLDADALGKVLKMLGQSSTDEDVDEIIHDFAEGNTMSLDEFLDFMTRQLSGNQEKREEDLSKEFKNLLKETFVWYDKDGDGIISWNELKEAMQSTGEVIQDWEVDEMMKDGDENSDKLIDFDEWINMMKELEGHIQC